jgi:hypothetical protein
VKTRVFVEVLSMKTMPSCGDLFIDIQDLQASMTFFIGLRMYQFYCVFCELFKYNVITFTLHLRGVLRV